MTYSIHGSAAREIAVQFGTQAEIAENIGGADDDGDEGIAMVLNDIGNMHALILTGSREELRAFAQRVLDGVNNDANFPAENPDEDDEGVEGDPSV